MEVTTGAGVGVAGLGVPITTGFGVLGTIVGVGEAVGVEVGVGDGVTTTWGMFLK